MKIISVRKGYSIIMKRSFQQEDTPTYVWLNNISSKYSKLTKLKEATDNSRKPWDFNTLLSRVLEFDRTN